MISADLPHGVTAPQADGLAAKLRRIQAVTDAALSTADTDDLFETLLERSRALLGMETAAVLLLHPPTGQLISASVAGSRELLDLGLAEQVAATGRALVRNASTAAVPIIAHGRVIGVLLMGASRQVFTGDDIDLLHLIADRAAIATQAMLSQLDRVTALALQRSLLPARLPEVAGFTVAARYIPGEQVGVGGDWYDLFTLPSGHVGIAIGDVAGNGLRAAVVMSRIRSALRAYALETTNPADVLARLDRKIHMFEPDAMATAAYGVISPDRGELVLSLAGHLPPLLIPPDGPATRVCAPPDLPLGADPDRPRRTTTVQLDPGYEVLLYTDGLVERRESLLDDMIEALAGLIRADHPDSVCASALQMLDGRQATDDVAILAVRRDPVLATSSPEHQDQRVHPPEGAPSMAYQSADDLMPLRQWATDQAERAGLSARRTGAVALTVSEMATNTLRHTSGTGRITAWATSDSFVIQIVDTPDLPTVVAEHDVTVLPDNEGGRGLMLVRALSDEVITSTDPAAVAVLFRLRIDDDSAGESAG